MEFESLNDFRKLGYMVQEPSLTDKTYFLVKHTGKESKRIYIKIGKKSAKVEVLDMKGTKSPLTSKESRALEKLIFEDLNLTTYSFI